MSQAPRSAGRRRAFCHALPLIAVLLLATALRFYRLDAQSFWNDEGNTARLVERSVALIIEGAAGDIHPPGYYLILHLWRSMTGESEFALRAFSAFCGTLTVAVVAAISRRAGIRSLAWVAAAVVALHPLSVYYGQEARMYAQLGLVAALTLWAAIRLVGTTQKPKRPAQLVSLTVALGLCITAGLYTQYTYVLALVGLNLAFGLMWLTGTTRRWSVLGAWVTAHLLGGLAFLPWAPIALRASDWRPPDLAPAGALRTMAQTLLVGVTYPGTLAPAYLVILGLLVLGALALSLWHRQESVRRFTLWAALGMAFGPPLLIAFAGIYRPAYLKFLIVSVAPLAVVMAASLQVGIDRHASQINTSGSQRRLRQLPQVLAFLLVASFAPVQINALQHLYADPAFARDDYRGLAAHVRQEGRPGDAVLLSAPNQWEVFTYYYRGPLPVYPAPYRPTRAEAEAWVADIVQRHQEGKLFVLFWGDLESDPERLIEKALSHQAYKAGDTWVTTIRLAHYGAASLPEIPQTPTDVRLGNAIELVGFAAPPPTASSPGKVLPLTLFWRTDSPLAEPLKAFVHLLDETGALVAQVDMEPQTGFFPTPLWPTGETVVDRYGVYVPSDLPPGRYTLQLGMYRFAGDRLPITRQGAPVGDSLPLAQIDIGGGNN